MDWGMDYEQDLTMERRLKAKDELIAELLEALERHTKMFEMFCDKVDFKHTYLDAETIAEWNEAGIQASKAIRKAKEN